MARSRRKPYLTEQQFSRTARIRLAKRLAARAVRVAPEVSDHGAYKKESNPWNIRDWTFYAPADKKAYRK
jgi:hypothetical protein